MSVCMYLCVRVLVSCQCVCELCVFHTLAHDDTPSTFGCKKNSSVCGQKRHVLITHPEFVIFFFGPPPSCESSSVLHFPVRHLPSSTLLCVIFRPPPLCVSSSAFHLPVCHPPSYASSSLLYPPIRHLRPSTFVCVIFGPPPSCVSSSALHLPVCHLRSSTFPCVTFGLHLLVRHLRPSTQAHLDQGKNKTTLGSGPGHLSNAASEVSVQRAQKAMEELRENLKTCLPDLRSLHFFKLLVQPGRF